MKEVLIKKIEELTKNAEINEEQLIQQLKLLISETEYQTLLSNEPVAVNKVFAEYYEKNTTIFKTVGISTGYSDLDNVMGNLVLPNDYVILGGRPSTGKTQFLINLCYNFNSKLTKPVLYISYDVDKYQLAIRYVAAATKIAQEKIIRNELNEKERDLLFDVTASVKENPTFFINLKMTSFEAFREYCKKYVEKNDIKVIVIDYIQLMTTVKPKYSRESELTHVSRCIKQLSKELNICIIAASQMNRNIEYRYGERKPMLSDLRDSGSLEQDADRVWLLYRPVLYGIDVDNEGRFIGDTIEVNVAKNRCGKTGSIKLQYNDDFTTFTDYIDKNEKFDFNKARLNDLDVPF